MKKRKRQKKDRDRERQRIERQKKIGRKCDRGHAKAKYCLNFELFFFKFVLAKRKIK